MEGIFIDLLFTIFCYLVFPVLYRVTEGTVDAKVANRLALINSIVVCVIFCFFRAIITQGQDFASSFAPAVFYYFIAKAILVKCENKNKQNKTENKKDVANPVNVIETTKPNTKDVDKKPETTSQKTENQTTKNNK